MKNYLAEKFKQERIARKLTLRDVAIGIGYRNINKGLRRLSGFEEYGGADVEFLNKIIDFFNWDREEVQQLLDLEHEECEKERQKQLDEPIEPYVVIKPFCGLYINLKLPESCKDQASAEQFALEKSKKIKAWYIISRRVSIYFEDGVRKGEWVQNGHLPHMSLGRNSKRSFVLEVKPEKN